MQNLDELWEIVAMRGEFRVWYSIKDIAMKTLNTMTDYYGLDSAREVVMYFLSNATSWKGETARRVKVELNAMLKNR